MSSVSFSERDQRAQRKRRPIAPLSDRFQFGSFGLAELAALRGVSLSTVRNDARAGVLQTFRAGKRVLAAGPVARRYLQQHRKASS